MKLEFPARQKVKRVHTLADAVLVCGAWLVKAGKYILDNPLCNFVLYWARGHGMKEAFKIAFQIN